MAKLHDDWIVLPHERLDELGPGLLTVVGQIPMPVLLAVTRGDGRVERITVPVETWLNGARTTTVRIGPACNTRSADRSLKFQMAAPPRGL